MEPLTFYLGLFGASFLAATIFPAQSEAVLFGLLTTGSYPVSLLLLWYRRYGRGSLLLSWVPIIGDPLTIVASVLRQPCAVFLALVTVAKAGRYLAIVAIQQGWFARWQSSRRRSEAKAPSRPCG